MSLIGGNVDKLNREDGHLSTLARVVIYAKTDNFTGPNQRPSSPIQAHFEMQDLADSVWSCPFRFRRIPLPSDQLNCRKRQIFVPQRRHPLRQTFPLRDVAPRA